MDLNKTIHQELPQDDFDVEKALVKDKDKDKEETDLMLEPEKESSSFEKPYRLEDDKCIRCLSLCDKIVFIIFCIVSIISIIKLSTGYNIYTEVYRKINEDTTMKLDIDEDTTMKLDIDEEMYSSSDSGLEDLGESVDFQDLSASMATVRAAAHHNQHKHHSSSDCSNYRYGCCEIYDACSEIYDDLFYTTIKLDPRVIHKHDELGTNCPRMTDIVEGYRDVYGSNDCENSQYGCCEVNFICDIRMYSQKKYNETVEYVLKIYQKNIRDNHVNQTTGIEKIDEIGSNCPSPSEIIIKYELGYPTVLDVILQVLFVYWFMCLCWCWISSGKRKYRRTRR